MFHRQHDQTNFDYLIKRTMIATANQELKLGLYTRPQAARFARISPQMLRYWVMGTSAQEPAMVRQFDNEDLVSFVELVQCLAIRAIRMEKKISLQRIRAAMEIARDQYDIDFPFARKHTTYLFEDDIVIRVPNEDGEDHIVQITGKYKHHDLIKPVGEFYMEELSYDPDGLAESYTPLANGARTIVLNPHVRFGHPTVQPCDISVDSLLNALASEGSIEAAADEYTVEREDVLFAVKYDDILSGVAS